MPRDEKKSKQESESDSSSSSSSSESDEKQKKNQKQQKREYHEKDKQPEKSIWDSPKTQAKSSRYEEKRRERRRSPEADNRDSSRNKSSRGDDRRHDLNRGRRSPERKEDNRRKSPDRRDRDEERRNRKSPQDRRRQEDSGDVRRERSQERKRSPPERRRDDDSRGDRRDNDRRKRSHSRERPSTFGNRNKGGFKQRRFNNKEEDDSNYEWGKKDIKEDPDEPEVEKEKPNFGLSGKLTEETNKVNGIVIKYAEPEEAKIPKRRWRFYPFKGETALQTLYIHRQSAYLIGRDRKICDIAVDHPSCSKQHAALQYRLVPYEREDGSTGKRVRPYIIDLGAANGTFINNKKIDAKKYVELLEKDVIKFGFSSREYVLLHEASKDEAEDDEVADEPEAK